ncbi:MAG: hypothetical protein PW845_29890 [Pseudomonas sp.]|nr:hypothetical protein [Pseudomonas sp.]
MTGADAFYRHQLLRSVGVHAFRGLLDCPVQLFDQLAQVLNVLVEIGDDHRRVGLLEPTLIVITLLDEPITLLDQLPELIALGVDAWLRQSSIFDAKSAKTNAQSCPF